MNNQNIQYFEKLSFQQQFELIKIVHETKDDDAKRYAKILLASHNHEICPKEWFIPEKSK